MTPTALDELETGTMSVETEEVVVDVAPSSQEEESRGRRERARATRWNDGIDWPVAGWIAVLHVGALAAPFYFTWKAVALALFLGWLTGGVGICLGFHRLFSHASFGTSKPLRWAIAFLGGLAGEGSCLHWVANHRKHHVYSDLEGDPHSPLDGSWWSHMLWFLPKISQEDNDALHRRWAPDLMKDPFIRFLDKTFILWHLLFGAVLYAIGAYFWDSYTGWSFVVWGMFVRLVYVLHATWFVNSATHMWGYRNYETTDQSRNLWWVALLTYGEGWHNNHHAHPRGANHGHRWFEVDVTYVTIRLLEKVGLFRNVVHTQTSHRYKSVEASE
jgi:stearoyl-CoA desaturase (delta-9 desaturase)